MLKKLVRRPFFRELAASVFAGYFRFVRWSTRLILDPEDFHERLGEPRAMVVTMWHGEHFMMPFLKPDDRWTVKAMISRSQDGEMNVLVAEKLGIGAIRASGGRSDSEVRRRGGVAGFVAALRELEAGNTVCLTADVPKGPAKIAGEGVVRIARRAGVPILPVATVTSNRHRLVRSWDRAAFNLPFGRFAIVLGEPITVACDADEAAIEAARQRVEAELLRVTARAYELVGGRDV
jgi:lysophospholipid acyltransferase (LPLAT)-like uncharacterized protein